MKSKSILHLIIALCWSPSAVSVASAVEPAPESSFFHHKSFADFAAGEVSSPGTGLYVARQGDQGEIRWINRYDYNNNGFPEVVAVNDHNHYDTPPAVIYRWGKDEPPLSLLPPIPEDRPSYEVLEHYVKAKEGAVLLPALGGLSAATADFNGDGFVDIALSAFVHGWNTKPYPLVIYPGGPEGFDPANPILWPAGFYTGIAAADLDGDGFADLVVPRRDGEYTTRVNLTLPRAERLAAASPNARKSVILFGGQDLDEPTRTLELETLYAMDAAAADLDGDGHPDIVFYEAGPDGGVKIYLAGEDRAFSGTGTFIEVGNNSRWLFTPRKLLLADLNGDGANDIVAPTENELVVLWNGGKGDFDAERKSVVPLSGVFATAAGDFNGDGKRDLAVAVFDGGTDQEDSSLVLMNNGKDITDWEQVRVPLQRAYGVTAADINGNGFDDVIFAKFFDTETGLFDTGSPVYWGGPQGIVPGNAMPLATFGATDVTTVPSAVQPGKRDILFVNRQSGNRGAGTGPTSGGVPSFIYWGNPTRAYSELDMLKLPALADALPITTADLAAEDGTAHVVAFEHGHSKLSIFRIADGAYERVKSFDLPPVRARFLQAADIDRDGVLDVLATTGDKLYLIRNPLAAEAALEEVELPSPITGGFALGDIDGDGLVDLVYGSEHRMVVVPGVVGGFDADRSYHSLEMKKSIRYPDLADFDGDGRLDLLALVFSEVNERGVLGNKRTDSMLFWNRDGKIDLSDPTPVPTFGGSRSGVVSDVNFNGRPDIVSANYHGGDTRKLDAQVLWNDGSRKFTRDNSVTLPAFSAAAAQAMDYDRDGFMDLLIFNHSEAEEVFPGLSQGARHSVGAHLYWGGSDGFAKDRFTWIPTYGPHSKQIPDPGNSADRSPRESYTSSPIPVPDKFASGFIEVKARLGPSGSIAVETRSAGQEDPPSAWKELPLVAQSEDNLRFGPVPLAPGSTFQYRLVLDSALLGTFPVVEEVVGISAPELAK